MQRTRGTTLFPFFIFSAKKRQLIFSYNRLALLGSTKHMLFFPELGSDDSVIAYNDNNIGLGNDCKENKNAATRATLLRTFVVVRKITLDLLTHTSIIAYSFLKVKHFSQHL
ncbi:hypothetical protein H6776_01890 [Candidatus Nomurabacteria bacterium]|nr:hypothetical protein [Candidatus Nomurabacteria bacterium]